MTSCPEQNNMVDILNKILWIFILLACNHHGDLYKIPSDKEYDGRALSQSHDRRQYDNHESGEHVDGKGSGIELWIRRLRREDTAAQHVKGLNSRHPCIPNPCKNSGICHVDGEDAEDFQCACVLEHRGKVCNETMRSCAALFCQDIHECILTPDGAVCICVGGISGRLCKAVDVHQKPWDNLVYILSNRSQNQAGAFLGILATLMLITSLCLTIHCCRVNKKRRKLREDYKRMISEGSLSDDMPQDWLDVSNATCKQTLCCCRKNSPDRENSSADAAEDNHETASDDLSQKEEAFDRIMSYSTGLNVVKDRVPRRLKRYPSSSRTHMAPGRYHPTDHNTHAAGTIERTTSYSGMFQEYTDGYDHAYGPLTDVLDTDEYVLDIENDSYECGDAENEDFENESVSMVFDEDVSLLSRKPTGKRRSKNKTRKKLENRNLNMAFDDDTDLQLPPKGIKRHLKTHDEIDGKYLGMVSDEEVPLLQRKSTDRIQNYNPPLQRGKTEKRGEESRDEDSEPTERRRKYVLRDGDMLRQGNAPNDEVANEDMSMEFEKNYATAQPQQVENRRKYKAYSYSEVPHFIEISCHEACDNNFSNSTRLSSGRKTCGTEQQTRIPRQPSGNSNFSSSGKYRRYMLSKSGPARKCREKYQRNFISTFKTRNLKASARYSRDVNFNQCPDSVANSRTRIYEPYDTCAFSSNERLSANAPTSRKRIGHRTLRSNYSQTKALTYSNSNSNLNANADSSMPACHIDSVKDEPEICDYFSQCGTYLMDLSSEIARVEEYPSRENIDTLSDIAKLHIKESIDSHCEYKRQYDVCISVPSPPITRQNERICTEKDLYNTGSLDEVIVNENITDTIDEIADEANNCEPSLKDLAENCKRWLEQAEFIVAKLSKQFPPSDKRSFDGSVEGDNLDEKVGREERSPVVSPATAGSVCSEDDESTIVASDACTTDCSEATVTAQADTST